jgi:hypothetical protein
MRSPNAEPALLVALDACTLIEGVLFAGSDYPSARVLLAATIPAYRILLVAAVEQEVRRALTAQPEKGRPDRVPELDHLLARCRVVRVPNATAEQIAADKQSLLACLRHDPDAEIAVAFKHANPRPHVIVSSNKLHWRPTAELQAALGGVAVMRPRTFASFIGAAPAG